MQVALAWENIVLNRKFECETIFITLSRKVASRVKYNVQVYSVLSSQLLYTGHPGPEPVIFRQPRSSQQAASTCLSQFKALKSIF